MVLESTRFSNTATQVYTGGGKIRNNATIICEDKQSQRGQIHIPPSQEAKQVMVLNRNTNTLTACMVFNFNEND